MNPTINVDVDGVVYDFEGQIKRYAEKLLQRKLVPATHWHFWEDWGLTERQWHDLFKRAVLEEEIFLHGPPVDGALGVLSGLEERGWTIRFVTNKQFPDDPDMTAAARYQTIQWMHKKGLGHHQLAFAADKTRFDADVVIDDKPDLSWVQKGRINLLYDNPWNRDVRVKSMVNKPLGVNRVHGWDGVRFRLL